MASNYRCIKVEGFLDQQRRIVVERCSLAVRTPPLKDSSARDNVETATKPAATASGGQNRKVAIPLSVERAGTLRATSRLPWGQPSGTFGAEWFAAGRRVPQLSPMELSRWQWWPGPMHSTVPGVISAPLTSTMTASELATHMRSLLRTPLVSLGRCGGSRRAISLDGPHGIWRSSRHHLWVGGGSGQGTFRQRL
jgi:hypothetical protein